MPTLPRSIAAVTVIVLALICSGQTKARAHYDLQDHKIYASSSTAEGRLTKELSHANKPDSVLSRWRLLAHYHTTAHEAHEHPAETTPKKSAKQKRTARAAKQTQTGFDPWKLLEFAVSPAYAFTGKVTIVMQGPFRVIRSNGIPDHQTGAFPNEGNPNTISEQDYEYRVPKDPQKTGRSTPLGMSPFGVAVNGVPFDPGAAEWWDNDPNSGWQYEAMYLGARLGIDQNNAHVQPNGAYHYHGPPTGLLQRLAAQGKPVLIGYAADGFPIYGPYGYKNASDKSSGLKKLKSSYRLKSGTRASAPGPGGRYDGAFVADYEFVRGAGDLDDCNGVFGITPEYPQGIYHYCVTDTFPYIPRGFKGTPDQSFIRRSPPDGMRPGGRGGQGGHAQGGPPGFGQPPPVGPPGHGQYRPGPPGFGRGRPPGHGPGQGQWHPPDRPPPFGPPSDGPPPFGPGGDGPPEFGPPHGPPPGN